MPYYTKIRNVHGITLTISTYIESRFKRLAQYGMATLKVVPRKLLTTTILALGLSNPMSANTTSQFPRGCEVVGFGFNKNYLILNEHGEQEFYLLQNRSNQQIEIEHYETHPDVFMSPKLESKIDPMHWSAFASDVANMYFACYVKQGEERVSTNCNEVLDVCQYPRVKFALSNMGNYWVSTDKLLQQVLKDSTAKGIFLHW